MSDIHRNVCFQAASYWNLSDILVVGAILYTGTDPGGRQASTVFVGNSLVKDLVISHKTDVRKLLDQLTTTVKYVLPFCRGTTLMVCITHCRSVELNQEGGLFPLPTTINPIFTGTNGARDRDKKIVGRFFVSCIGK